MAAQANNAASMQHNAVPLATLMPIIHTINTAWRTYQFNLEIGNINHIVISAPQYRALGEGGLKAISNRFSNFIQGPVDITREENTTNILIKPSDHFAGRVVALGNAALGERKNLSGKLPRPPNSFILYRQQHHPAIKEAHPALHNNQISLILGKKWRNESEEVKNYFKFMAEELKKKHLREHPDYHYQPRKPSEKKRRMTRRKAEAQAQALIPSSGPIESANAVLAGATEEAGVGNSLQLPGTPFPPQLELTSSENMILDLGKNDLDSTTLGAMIEAYNVGKPSNHNIGGQAFQLPGTAALHSERVEDAQNEHNFYLAMGPGPEVDFADDQEQLDQFAMGIQDNFEDLLARYTTFCDE